MRPHPILAVCAAALLSVAGCGQKRVAVVDSNPIITKALSDTASRFYIDFSQYPGDMKDLPIGVFDSGTGGLTVLERLLALDAFNNISGAGVSDDIKDFAGEHFVYLADQANMPYGTYDAAGKASYLKELVVKDALFLLGNNYYKTASDKTPDGVKPRCKILVIACNTATAYGLEDVERLLEGAGCGVKVIGVINAGSAATLDRLEGQKSPYAIGVLATQGTIASGAYERTLRKMIEDRGITTAVTIVNQSGYGFAEAVDGETDFVNPNLTEPREGYRGPRIGNGDADLKEALMGAYNFNYDGAGILFAAGDEEKAPEIQLNSAENYARFNFVSLVERHRQSGSLAPLKALILGCTHYPFQLETLQQTAAELRAYNVDGVYPYRDLISPDLVFIDPAYYTSVECYQTLRKDGNLAFRITPQEVSAFISVPSADLEKDKLTPDGRLTYEFKYGRETGTEDITTKQVPFAFSNIDENNLERIKRLLPHCYSLIYPTLR